MQACLPIGFFDLLKLRQILLQKLLDLAEGFCGGLVRLFVFAHDLKAQDQRQKNNHENKCDGAHIAADYISKCLHGHLLYG